MNLASTYKDYIEAKDISLHGTKKAVIPKPELYLIYSGNKGKKPEVLSFTKEFFGGNERAIEIKAKVIYGDSKKHDMISQYIAYCKVLDMQVKKHGRTKKAIEETIRICSDKDILKEYLEAHRKEVVDIMTQLYDREREMKLYVKEKENDAARKSTLEAIKKLMKKLKMSAKEAMDFLEISPKDQKTYLPMLKKG
jgi:RNA polymerase-binding transcription factor DksA